MLQYYATAHRNNYDNYHRISGKKSNLQKQCGTFGLAEAASPVYKNGTSEATILPVIKTYTLKANGNI